MTKAQVALMPGVVLILVANAVPDSCAVASSGQPPSASPGLAEQHPVKAIVASKELGSVRTTALILQSLLLICLAFMG